MRLCQPDWRWSKVLAAIEAGDPPTDPFLADVYNVKRGISEDEDLQYVLDLYEDRQDRDTLVAFFLCRATYDEMTHGTGVEEKILRLYGKLFVDLAVFRNKMEWRKYVLFYVENCCVDEKGKIQVMKGVTDGPYALIAYWRIGEERLLPSNKVMIEKVLIMALEKSLLARNSSILSEASKEAFKWGKAAMDAIKVRDSIRDVTDGETQAITAIKKRKATLLASDLQTGLTPQDILH